MVGNLESICVQGTRFVDAQGRHVLLHGINLVNKDPDAGYFFDEGSECFAAMADWGFNCVRLGVIWDGLEPEPGVYDEGYLRELDRRIAWAKAHGLVVFLDMHQDLYSVLFSDGAPEWATLTGGALHVDMGGVWSDAYFTSPAVQAALDSFWTNAPARDGLGLQEHYAAAWAHLARRYVDEPTVVGYDLMNEPFPGSPASASIQTMFAKGAELLSALDGVPTSAEELSMLWLDERGRFEILGRLEDVELYAQVIDVTQPIYSAFERGALAEMYQRVAAAIRAVDADKALFLETTMGSNMGTYSGVRPVELNGRRDPRQVYAAHGYDLVVDTPSIARAAPGRVELIFRRHAETARRLEMPMLVGEWGAYGRHEGTLPAAWQVVRQFEKALCSDTYWAYEPGIEGFPCFQALQRPYPERVAGTLLGYHYDPERATFECTWREEGRVSAPSRVYLPDWLSWDEGTVELTPAGQGFEVAATQPGSESVYLTIPPVGGACERRLIVGAGSSRP